MQALRVALIQLPWAGNQAATMQAYQEYIAQAAQNGAQLIGLPEFTLAPYFAMTTDPSGFDWAESLSDGVSARFFGEMAQKYKLTLIGSLYERTPDGQYFDTAVVYDPNGAQIAATRKIHIPAGAGYHENHFFKGDSAYPICDLGGLKLATPTCYDQWFPELARIYSMNGAELIFYPTAIGSEPNIPNFDSQNAWQTVMRGHAIANGIFIGAANRIGTEGILTFYGSSFIADPMGNIIAQASRDQAEIIYADLDPQIMLQWRDLFPLMHQRRPATYSRLLESDLSEPPPAWLVEQRQNDLL